VSGNNIKLLTKDDIVTHLKAFLDGKLIRDVKSEPVPPKNNDRVKRLVGSTFERSIKTWSRKSHVFCMFYDSLDTNLAKVNA
jgi:hypothetical protein